MYVTSKMASRWKEIHWWQIDKRCWEATYGPNTQGPAHLREAKDGDGEPWPEWTGEQPCDHHDNEARETARNELERDLITPDFTEIVGAAVAGHLISIATETTMSHLFTYIFHLPEPSACGACLSATSTYTGGNLPTQQTVLPANVLKLMCIYVLPAKTPI
jgi:hypothetical protein